MDRDLKDPGSSTDSDAPFWLDNWYVDPPSGRISQQGAEVKLEPKVMSILVYLAQHQGEVISREELEEAVWPNVIVGYDALSGTIIKLRKALGDDSRNPRYLETISKKGYRLLVPVTLQADKQVGKPELKPAGISNPVSVQQNTPLFRTAGLLVAGLLVMLAVYRFTASDGVPEKHVVTGNEKPSLVVLPFANSNNNREQEYFSDGITDDLINDLSQYSGLNVMARRTSYTYKQGHADIHTIGRDLGVTYVVDGDVRRDGNRLRINVQLIDASTGLNIWAERFDRETRDIFAVQDDIRKNIISSLAVTLTAEERNREQIRFTSSFEAYDVFLQGQARLVSRTSAADNLQAQALMEKAVQIDPNFARAHAALAYTLADGFRQAWITDPEKMRRDALAAGKRAIELDPGLYQAYWIMGNVYLFMFEDYDRAIEMGEKAVELAPNDSDGLLTLAVIYDYSGNPAKGRLIAQDIMKRNTAYSSLVPAVLGLANVQIGKYEEAMVAYNKSLEINPTYVSGLVHKVLINYRMGKLDDALFQVDELYNLHPNFNLQQWAARLPFRDKSINRAYISDLTQAGIKP